jgi:peptide/nickel transport system ATP-binding protein
MASIPVPGRTLPGERLGAIPGMVPSLIGELRGCAFRERCSHATAVCAEPVEPRSEAGHDWRCVLTEIPAEAA